MSINKVTERTQQICGDLARVGRSYYQVGPVTVSLPGKPTLDNKRHKDMWRSALSSGCLVVACHEKFSWRYQPCTCNLHITWEVQVLTVWILYSGHNSDIRRVPDTRGFHWRTSFLLGLCKGTVGTLFRHRWSQTPRHGASSGFRWRNGL